MSAVAPLAIEAARPQDRAAIEQLLVAAGLPIEDLQDRSLGDFLVARDGERLIGTVGLDFAGDAALLRSLAVAPAARGRGLGQQLVAAAERRAWQRGAQALYLLTTTAAEFFARLDYRKAARADAPPAIAAMPQFAGLCPASSAFMTKRRG